MPMMWRRLDAPGHEWARLIQTASGPALRGTAVFIEDLIPGRLDFKILCISQWETQRADILGWIAEQKVKLRIEKAPGGDWLINGSPEPLVKGCLDLDLAFSPSTNLLPIRRLNLNIGQEAEARAAWLRYPNMALHPLVQRIRRESKNIYSYSSDNGFSTQLEVNADGFVVNYPPLWAEEMGK
jgi:hypothetical protein